MATTKHRSPCAASSKPCPTPSPATWVARIVGSARYAERISSIHELSHARLDDALDARDAIYVNLFREHPFKRSVKAEQVLEEILGNRDFRQVMDLG